MINLLTSCNIEKKIAQNIYIHNSNRNYKKFNYNNNNNQETDRHRLQKLKKTMPRTRVSLNSKAHQLGWLKTKNLKNSSRLIRTNKLQPLKNLATKFL